MRPSVLLSDNFMRVRVALTLARAHFYSPSY